MPREPIPTWFFVLVVVRHQGRFLLIQETEKDQPWYLPAGRVEAGEGFIEAAERETLEEAGVAVQIQGVIEIEHTPWPDGARLRVLLYAEPKGDPTPKQFADEHSLGAKWITLEELDTYPLRGKDVRRLFEYVAANNPIYSIDILHNHPN